jgi:hypothetical protein
MKMYQYQLIRSLPRCIASSTLLACFVVSLSAPDVFAEEGSYNDPSDVTRLVTSASPLLEYHRYENKDLPDDGMLEVKVEGQYSKGSILLLGDIGYGYRTGNSESGMTDSRIRFFHVPYRNDIPSAWISAFGWSIDSRIPFGDVEKGLGAGNWVFAPGIIWTNSFEVVDVSPNLVYQFTWANNELREDIPDSAPNESRAIRLEVNFAIDMPSRYWLLVTPAYTWDIKSTEDAAYIKAFTGYNINSSTSLGIEGQYNVDVRDGLLQEVIRGEKWRLRIQWENYF